MNVQNAELMLSFAEDAGAGLRGLLAKALIGQIEWHYGELCAAMQWFIDAGRTGEALRLASSLALFWTTTRRLDQGSAWFDRVLAAPGAEDASRGQALFDAGLLAFWAGDDERARALHTRALAIGRQIHDPTVTALALSGLARVALRTRDIGEARILCREALAITKGMDDSPGRSNTVHVLAVTAQMVGDFEQARVLMSERIAVARKLGDYATLSAEVGNLSMVERELGNLDRADALAREALEINLQRGDARAMPYKVSELAAVATELGEVERAATLVGAVEAMIDAQAVAWPPDERARYHRTLAALAEAMGAAAFVQARAAGRSMSTLEVVDFALGAFAAA